jgi:hypothetical protein
MPETKYIDDGGQVCVPLTTEEKSRLTAAELLRIFEDDGTEALVWVLDEDGSKRLTARVWDELLTEAERADGTGSSLPKGASVPPWLQEPQSAEAREEHDWPALPRMGADAARRARQHRQTGPSRSLREQACRGRLKP